MSTLNLTLLANAGDTHASSAANDAGKRPNLGVVVDALLLSPGSHGSGDEYSAGCRFTSVTIGNADTINSADFSMRANATYAPAATIAYIACCQAADNAGALATSGSTDLDGATRPGTTADTQPWTVSAVTGGTRYTVSITSAVQELVNRAGWASGNAACVLIDTRSTTTQGEWQDWDAFNTGGTTNGPHLDIDYTTAGAGASIVPIIMAQRRMRLN